MKAQARRAARSAPLLATLGVAVALAGACGSAEPRTSSSPGAREALAGRVLDIVSGNGIPVQGDHVACSGALDGRSDVCTGLTATEPVDRIEGTFTPGSGSAPGSSCPGRLTVTIGPSPGYLNLKGEVRQLTSVSEDPCR